MATYVSKRPYLYGTGRRKSSVARDHDKYALALLPTLGVDRARKPLTEAVKSLRHRLKEEAALLHTLGGAAKL